MAYRAEIEVGVKGAQRLQELRDRINKLSNSIDAVNAKEFFGTKAAASINNYNSALTDAQENLNKTRLRLDEAGRAAGNYARSIREYVVALELSNGAQALTNRLISEEIELRRKQKLAAAGIVETAQAYASPIGPAESPLQGQTSPVGQKIAEGVRKFNAEMEALHQNLAQLESRTGNPFGITAQQIELAEHNAQAFKQQIQQVNLELDDLTRLHAALGQMEKGGKGPFGIEEAQIQEAYQVRFNEEKAFKQLRFDTIQQSLRAELDSVDEVLNARIQADKKYLAEFDKRLNTRLANKNVSGFRTDGPLESPKFKSTKKSIGKMGESLALGAGFPLLFGGGAGSVAGSILGSFVGSGFGGQILGGALGQALDQAVSAAARLANTLETGGDNFSKLREEGIYFTAELEKQVRAAREVGNAAEANRISTAAVAAQTGDIGGLAGRGTGAAVNELEKAWNGVTKAVGTTLGIIAGPFIFALNIVLRGVQGIFLLINALATGIAHLINLIPGAKQLGDALYEKSLEGTAAYENQLAELDKQIKAEYELVELAKVRTGYLEQMLGKSKATQDILGKQADAAERLKKFEQEIKAFRASAPDGTSELRRKALEQETQMRIKFTENEKQIMLKNANEMYNTIQENNKRVADAQRGYDEQRHDMVRAAARAQADFDLQVTRRLEDARMKMREQELDYVQKVRQEELKTLQLLNRERQLERSITGALSADPEQAEIINTVQTAVENYRAGRMAVEEEARAAQEKAQLEYSKVQVQIERYKYDNALRINRANEDSQIKIAKINDQIRRQNEEASKQEFKRQGALITARIKEQMTAASTQYWAAEKALPGALTQADKEYYKEIMAISSRIYYEYENLDKKITATINSLQIAKLQPMAQAPALSDTSGAASAQEEAANKQLLMYQQQIQKLQQINGLKNEELQLAQALLAPGADSLKQFNDLIKQQKDRAAYEREYGELLRKGIKPELAEQLAVINQMEEAQLRLLDNVINTVEALNNDEFKGILDRLKEIRGGVTTKAEEARAGVVDVVPGQRLQEFINKSEDELKDLEALAIRVADGIGNAIANSMSQGIVSLIEGTKDAQQVFADFLKSVGDVLIQEGTRMIAMYIAIGIAKAFAGLGGKGGGTETNTQFMERTGNLDLVGDSYKGLQGFATGGFVTSPTSAVVGEGGEPEYIIPASKMRGAMNRYAAGARGSSVIPGSGEQAGGEMGGGTAVATPIDVRYTVERINSVDYVTADQFQRGMRTAAEQGALRGEQRTLANIRQNTTTRRRLGL